MMSCTCRVPILSCAKIASIFFSECCRLVLPSTVLPEPYTSLHKLGSISGTSLHYCIQRSRGHHRSLRAIGCISNKWVIPETIVLVQGTHTALRSVGLEMLKKHWSEMSVTTLRLEIFCSHWKTICSSPFCSIIFTSLSQHICLPLVKMRVLRRRKPGQSFRSEIRMMGQDSDLLTLSNKMWYLSP